jgi:hypothetical protein
MQLVTARARVPRLCCPTVGPSKRRAGVLRLLPARPKACQHWGSTALHGARPVQRCEAGYSSSVGVGDEPWQRVHRAESRGEPYRGRSCHCQLWRQGRFVGGMPVGCENRTCIGGECVGECDAQAYCLANGSPPARRTESTSTPRARTTPWLVTRVPFTRGSLSRRRWSGFAVAFRDSKPARSLGACARLGPCPNARHDPRTPE